MKFEKWALNGDIAGAAAIVATLVALIAEVRNNTAAVRAAVLSDILDRFHEFGLLAPQNLQMAEVNVPPAKVFQRVRQLR